MPIKPIRRGRLPDPAWRLDVYKRQLRWFIRSGEKQNRVEAAFGSVEYVVGRQDAFFTKPLGRDRIDALQQEGFAIQSAIPVLD